VSRLLPRAFWRDAPLRCEWSEELASSSPGATRYRHTDNVFGRGKRIAVDSEDPSYVLTVVHSDARGTKKAVDDCIYEAGLSNIGSSHRDFSRYGIAYDINAIDQSLSEEQLQTLVDTARSLSGDEDAIRSIRLVDVDSGPEVPAAE